MGGAIGLPEKIAFGVVLVLFLPFAILSFQLTTGLPLFFKSAIPVKGPVLIAMDVFTLVIAITAI